MAPEGIVYIVDDDEAVRDSLVMLLESRGHRTSSFASAEAFLGAVATPSLPGCLLLDVNMPGTGGLGLLGEIGRIAPRLPVLMITGRGEVAIAVQAMKAGARDFLEKPLDPDTLFALVDQALAASAQAAQAEEERSKAQASLDRLTPRERSVFDRLAEGKTNKQVAAELNISPRTIEIHRAKLMEKLRVTSVSELIGLSARIDSGRKDRL
ncbi:DNA-binding response regulator [Hypericibacter adhaerens]|uniref:DNA-binding response regulator n=2 Tax=Hypericibacter adhaerens TaxID=2602016 RepID=A0A5J6MZQ5_9PROT|nr:DNA-binding response regulator [Hypericibacter adhaerens]